MSQEVKSSEFKTELILKNTTVYALSDIHADIDVLLVSLRDCAQVIRKKQII